MIPAPVGHHCPTCVEEARREFRKGPGRRIAVANARSTSGTKLLLGAILAMYVIEIANVGLATLVSGPSAQSLYELGGSAGIAVAAGQYWRLFTEMFLHAGLLHLAFNCYALWIFGQVIEQELGRARVLVIFFVTGLFASAASYAFQPSPFVVGVGASGAIVGIFGAFVAYNWRRRNTALGAARLRSAALIILLNFFITFSVGGAIDWRAHLGGLVGGVIVGFAAEGFGRFRNERVTFAAGCAVLLVATVVLVVWRTAQIKTQFPQFF